jgi:hypothetical protein
MMPFWPSYIKYLKYRYPMVTIKQTREKYRYPVITISQTHEKYIATINVWNMEPGR